MLRKNKNWFSIDLRRWIERVFLSRRSYRRWNKSSMQILLAGIQPFSYLTIIYIHIRIFPYFFIYILFCFADLVNSSKSNRHENGLLIVSQPVFNFDLQRNSTKTLSNRLSIIQGGCRKIAFKLKTFITLFL